MISWGKAHPNQAFKPQSVTLLTSTDCTVLCKLVNICSILYMYVASLRRGKGCTVFWGRLDKTMIAMATKCSHLLTVANVVTARTLHLTDLHQTCR